MADIIELAPVDQVEITTLFENLVDLTSPGGGIIERLGVRSGNMVVSKLHDGQRRAVFQTCPDAFVQNMVGTRITMKGI